MDGHLVFAQNQLVQYREVRLIGSHDMVQDLGDTPGIRILLLIQLKPGQIPAGGRNLFGDGVYPGIPMSEKVLICHSIEVLEMER